jgi:hypothetical protein
VSAADPAGRPIVLRANRVAAAGLWAAAIAFAFVAALCCIALLAVGDRETPVVFGLVAVAVLVAVRIHLRPGRLVDLRLDADTCRIRRVGRPEVLLSRHDAEGVLWLRRRYEHAAAPVVAGLYLLRGDEVILFTRAPTLEAERIRRFFAAGGMGLKVTESADPPLEKIDPVRR